MKFMLHKSRKVISVIFLSLIFLSATLVKDWKAPVAADKLKNPYKNSVEATKAGGKMYKMYCVICHGDKGKGDGLAGVALNPKPGDFTSTKIQAQTDGAIYWKLTNGRAPMASYKNVLTVKQRWQLVNHIRKLGKK